MSNKSTFSAVNSTLQLFPTTPNDKNATWLNVSQHESSRLLTPTTRATESGSRDILEAPPGEGTITTVLCFSTLVFASSCLVLLVTHYTGDGRSATSVFMRSMCVSDILMSIYGMSKMTMLMFLDRLNINFFLPEGFMFTASLAFTVSLLFLNLDYYMRLIKPLQYTQADKDTVITVMLLMWNAVFIVGFLPLMGWNLKSNTVHFFSFFPWPYLFLNGCINFACVLVCVGYMVSLKRSQKLYQLDFDCFSTGVLEVTKHKHLHRIIIVNSAVWLLCYLPFFVFIAITWIADIPYRDSVIIYFIPVFLMKSLLSSVVQGFKTFSAFAIIGKLISGASIMTGLREWIQEKIHRPKEMEITAISYINPLCEMNYIHSNREDHMMHDQNHFTLHRGISEAELIQVSESYSSPSDSNTSLNGITNCVLLSTLHFGQTANSALQETTQV